MGRPRAVKAPTTRQVFNSRGRHKDPSTTRQAKTALCCFEPLFKPSFSPFCPNSSITCRRFLNSNRRLKCPQCFVFPPSLTCCQMCLTCSRRHLLAPSIRTSKWVLFLNKNVLGHPVGNVTPMGFLPRTHEAVLGKQGATFRIATFTLSKYGKPKFVFSAVAATSAPVAGREPPWS